MDQHREQCPECGERAGVPIVHGLATEELFDDPGIALGGCVVGPDPDDMLCRACQHTWRTADHRS